MTYEADQEGVLKIVAQEGDTLPVGETIAEIGEGDAGGEQEQAEPTAEEQPAEAEAEAEEEAGAEGEGEAEEEAPREEPEEEADEGRDGREREAEPVRAEAGTGGEPGEPGEGGGDGDGRVKASPVAKRMAREMGLSLSDLSGSGPGGRIVKADVEAAAKGGGAQTAEAEAPAQERPAPAEAPAEDGKRPEVPPAVVGERDGGTGRGEVTQQELTRLQQTVARRMAESKATAPDFVISVEVDMEEAIGLRTQIKAAAAEGEPVPSFNDFVVKAAALALREYPRANGAYKDGRFEFYSRVNVGVAVAGQDALVVPTVFDADRKSLGTIARESRALAERVRAGAISPPELSGGTFTVSNLGMYGIRRFVAILNSGQAGILAVGEMKPTPVVRDGQVQVRTVMEMMLSCDHRILYGADAAEFLARIRERLERPFSLTL
jgi:pyruvate dehydrogenase E2 component (dihydrolipoamide acetyltransferase)